MQQFSQIMLAFLASFISSTGNSTKLPMIDMASELKFYQLALIGQVKKIEGYNCTCCNCTAFYSEISNFIGAESLSSNLYIMLEGVRGDLRVGDQFVAFGFICPDGTFSTYHGGAEIYKNPPGNDDQLVAGYLERFSELIEMRDERRSEVIAQRRAEACERTRRSPKAIEDFADPGGREGNRRLRQ
jgi:hypothetical protein